MSKSLAHSFLGFLVTIVKQVSRLLIPTTGAYEGLVGVAVVGVAAGIPWNSMIASFR